MTNLEYLQALANEKPDELAAWFSAEHADVDWRSLAERYKAERDSLKNALANIMDGLE